MVNIFLNKAKFSTSGRFVLYDWKDSKDEHHFDDKECLIYFFIKDFNPKMVLEELFLNPMKGFKFSAGLELKDRYEGKIPQTNFNYLFTSYELLRVPELNWSKFTFPMKRDTRLSDFKNERGLMKYLSKYIDN